MALTFLLMIKRWDISTGKMAYLKKAGVIYERIQYDLSPKNPVFPK